ncbi:JNK1/MAPK8-associated membrane protein isoform X3 [Anabrus simplex]|uniref:JNK1/MAPK8-associated membrane protein isoform X3 n=1 Tax=Anabrus simplex TaxID=316456 RepID=UPI0034DCC588
MRRETFMYLCSYAVMVSSEIEGGALLGGLSPCPGLYCGRQLLSDGNWSECSSCPRGYRANSSSACVECSDSPVFYDWLYLGFMALLALVLHWFCIDIAARRRSFCREVLVLHISAVFEIVTAAALTLLLSEPVGTLNVRSCHVKKLSDWYTLLHNPNPNYEETLHCTQEAVYPLLFFSLYHHCFIRVFKCSTLCFQGRSVYAVPNHQHSKGCTKYGDSHWSLAAACLWNHCHYSVEGSSLPCISCSISASASSILYFNSSIHRS